jgi:actin-related protein 9
LLNPFKTPTKQNKPKRVESTPRQERALRREFLRQRNHNTNGNGHPNVLHVEYGLFDDPFKMSNQQGKWREEQVLVICPGSHTTMAQLGCSELTPPAHRIATRMFKDEDGEGYRPYHTYKRKKNAKTAPSEDTKDEDEWEYIEDRDSVEGAIYPMQGMLANLAVNIILIAEKSRLTSAS